jgi:hypothetical protein
MDDRTSSMPDANAEPAEAPPPRQNLSGCAVVGGVATIAILWMLKETLTFPRKNGQSVKQG